ncbi:peptidase M43 [Chryseobacterium piperi]|uniref:Peptidase M43 n=1 Tax=Chryseobacterium piperi TaxID=558152 RepID=A0A086BK36_9FLAO|nr:M43 family zinc metalloprotease [Chryseobacterium piperi]ASW73857.1 zinc metalloprotease [Chryseobacterium piperi]KFF29300.1 peptidase M43 [Chryseobacterium piperi]
MKRTLFALLAVFTITACNNNDNLTASQDQGVNKSENNANARSKLCASEEIRKEALKNNPTLRARYNEIEQQAARYINNLKQGKVLPDGSLEIPVVVNLIYATSADNLSDSQIQDQIDVLNEDLSATNSDVSKIPAEFKPVAAGDTKVRFRLSKINRRFNPQLNWDPFTNSMKRSSTGGIDATDPTKNLNFWIVNRMSALIFNVQGFATFPESAGQWDDGIVVIAGRVGKTQDRGFGRVTTHEVGHYLNLRHIWGDANCGDDFCDDTPTQPSSNSGKPNYPLYGTCGGVQRSLMFMNYMDYVDGDAMYMFSSDQNQRIQATVSSNGPRASLR